MSEFPSPVGTPEPVSRLSFPTPSQKLEFIPFTPTSLPSTSPNDSFSMSEGERASYDALDQLTHAKRLERAAQVQDNKQTGPTYTRHVKNYENYWIRYQMEELAINPMHVSIPAYPVIAAKVAMFLEYETTRNKVSVCCTSDSTDMFTAAFLSECGAATMS